METTEKGKERGHAELVGATNTNEASEYPTYATPYLYSRELTIAPK